MAGAASELASLAAPPSGLPASEVAASEVAPSELAAAASGVAASEPPASVTGGGGGGAGLATHPQTGGAASHTAQMTGSHAPPSAGVPGHSLVSGVTVVMLAPPFSTMDSSMSSGAPGLTDVFGVQAPTRASAAVRPNTSKRGNGRFIQGSL